MTPSTPAFGGQTAAQAEDVLIQAHAPRPSIAEVLLPFWKSKEKWRALVLLSIILAITFSGTYGYVALNDIQGELTDALVALDWEKLKPLFMLSMLVGCLTVLLPILSAYVSGYLGLRWRAWMTHAYLDRWTRDAHFYSLERDEVISNTDQRIAEDIRIATEQSLDLFTSLISVVVNTITYTVLLWNVAGALEFSVYGHSFSLNGYMVYAAYLYCFCHLMLSHWLGKSLIGLNMHKQTVEADFRHQGMQVREHAEQIALYGGGERERHHLLARFERVRANTMSILARNFIVMFGQSAYSHVFTLLPTLLALPMLLSEKITYGDMVTIVGAYGMLSNTIAFFPTAYTSFTRWLALTNRLRDLSWAINKIDGHESEICYLRDVSQNMLCGPLVLSTPKGKTLAQLDSWIVEKGQRWLVTGPSGSGKSTLLRACSGLWPYGHGQICVPKNSRMMFLPQKSYIPTGRLKDALCYPHDCSAFTDEQCNEALIACCLPELAGSLSVTDQWQQKLSGGEQQRLAIARVLLQRPDYIFLDEATSALDLETEQLVYSAVIESLPESTLISVAHRKSLIRFHPHTLDLKP